MKHVQFFLPIAAVALLTTSSLWATGEKVTRTVTDVKTKAGTGRIITEVIEQVEGSIEQVEGSIEQVERRISTRKEWSSEQKTVIPLIQVGPDQAVEDAFNYAIQRTYATLTEFTKSNVSFKLSGFETLSSEHFDEIYYVDVFTFPDGPLIDMTRSTFTDKVNGNITVEYIPQWRVADTEWASFPEGRRMLAMTLEEILQEVATNSPEWLEITAVTLFEVEVTFEDKMRTYKAAFLWTPSDSTDTWQARPLDRITQAVDLVIYETLPLAGGVRFDPAVRVPGTSERVPIIDKLDTGLV